MGIGRLDLNDWIELDNQWSRYHQEKLTRFRIERASRLCQISPEAQDAALASMQLLSEYLVYYYPSLFEYQEEHMRIKATEEMCPIRSYNPLKYASVLIQDDFALMIEGSVGPYYLKAGWIFRPGF